MGGTQVGHKETLEAAWPETLGNVTWGHPWKMPSVGAHTLPSRRLAPVPSRGLGVAWVLAQTFSHPVGTHNPAPTWGIEWVQAAESCPGEASPAGAPRLLLHTSASQRRVEMGSQYPSSPGGQALHADCPSLC